MNKKINILVGCLLFVFSTLACADASVYFNKNKIKSHTGGQFSLDILMSDFPTTEGGGLVLHFNPKVVNVTNVSIDGNVWGFVNKVGDIDNNQGVVSDILFSDFRGVTGSARIATVEFETIHKGKSKIRLEESAMNPFVGGSENIAVRFKSAKIKVRR